MGRRGVVKCACCDCKKEQMLHRGNFDRAARPRCYACGGPMEVISVRGRESMMAGYARSREGNATRQGE